MFGLKLAPESGLLKRQLLDEKASQPQLGSRAGALLFI